jgi:hypothetical protein
MTGEEISKLVRYLNQIERGKVIYDYTPKPMPKKGDEVVLAQIVRTDLSYRKTADGEESYVISSIPIYLSIREAKEKLSSYIESMKTVLAAAEKLLRDAEEEY